MRYNIWSLFCKGDTCNVSGGDWDKKEGNVKEDATIATVFCTNQCAKSEAFTCISILLVV